MILIAQTVLFILIFVRPLGGDVMNITVTITVNLNVLQNASKCTISKEKIPKFFLGRRHSPLPRPNPVSNPLQTTFLATGLCAVDYRKLPFYTAFSKTVR